MASPSALTDVPSTDDGVQQVRLLHLSDTHNLHRTIEERFPLPAADMLLHTGDFTEAGRPEEVADFNRWLGELRARYQYIVVIHGNHEWSKRGWGRPDKAVLSRALSNATHVLEHETVDLMGLRICGSAWVPGTRGGNPDVPAGESYARAVQQMKEQGAVEVPPPHRFEEITPCDVLMTHGPPRGIFDWMEGSEAYWGSSKALRRRIEQVRPKVHLFGHLHEQRGVWLRDGPGYVGGVEYELVEGQLWHAGQSPQPPASYPCDLISCNAMKNHPGIERRHGRIAGSGRVIVAQRDVAPDGSAGEWRFSTEVPRR